MDHTVVYDLAINYLVLDNIRVHFKNSFLVDLSTICRLIQQVRSRYGSLL